MLRKFIISFYVDGHKLIGLVAPLLSISFTTCKLFEVDMDWLKELSYAWSLLPMFVWVFIAYLRRWGAYDSVISEYSHCLSLTGIILQKVIYKDEDREGYGYVLKLKNTINRPISYTVTTFDVNGGKDNGYNPSGGIISPQESGSFFSPTYAGTPTNPTKLDVVIEYGTPNKKIRVATRKMLASLLDNGAINFVYEEHRDEYINTIGANIL